MNNRIATGLLLLASLLGTEAAQAQQGITYVISEDVTGHAITPGTIYEIIGRKRQRDRTWGSVEINGEQVYKGPISLRSHGMNTSLYQVGPDTTVQVELPNDLYAMKDSIVVDITGWKPRKVECLVMEPDRCECSPGEGIVFGPDSITTNTNLPFKLIVRLADTDSTITWIPDGERLAPGIPVMAIDTLDTKEAWYAITVTTIDGRQSCDYFTLHRDEYDWETKFAVYRTSLREYGLRFAEIDKDHHTLDGKLITEIQVVKLSKSKSRGNLKQKHGGETRH